MAIIKTDGGYNALPISYKRGNPIPLDTTSVWYDEAKLIEYAKTGVTAYVGQVVSLVNSTTNVATAYIIMNTAGDLEPIGTAPVGDGATIEVSESGEVAIKGFADAAVGAQLVKTANGMEWKVPSTDTVDGIKTNVQNLLDTVNGIEASEGVEAQDGLVQKVAKNTTAIAENKAAIDVLNGDSSKEGSVAYQIAQIVGGAGESFDTLKEIADWIANHPTDAADYNRRITANEEAIEDLTELVGSKAVATQIAEAITAAIKVDGLDKYALASDLTTLAGRVNTAEGKISTIETAISNNPLHSHANKTELDKIVDGDVAKWNTAATDVSTIKSNIEKDPLHTHTNKAVLDAITTEKVNAWDAAESNAKEHTETYAATKAQGALADTAVQTLTILDKTLSKTSPSLTVEEAKTALGLKSAAYEEASAFESAGAAKAVQGDTTHTVKEAYELASGKATMSDIETAIAGAGHASASDLSTHTGNATIHVTEAQKTKWNAAADLVDELTGGQASGITNTINTAINEHKTESEARYDAKYETITNVTAVKDRVTAVETKSATNETNLATLTNTVTGEGGHGERLASAESAISTLQTDSAKHALKTDVDSALALKADKSAYDETAATVAELKEVVDNFFSEDAKVEGAVDTLKEIAEYISNDTTGGADIVARVGSLEGAVGDSTKGLVKSVADNAAAIAAETTRATGAETALASRVKDLEDNKAGYATTTELNAAKEAAITSAATDATTKVNALANGAVATNTGNIATNTADITTLKDTVAYSANVYAKTETYTKAEVDAAVANAQIVWGTF